MHVLYISKSNCVGSSVALSIAQLIDGALLNIQNVDVLRKSQTLPDWLDGTPLLIDESVSIPYRGSRAIIELNGMAEKSSPPSSYGAPMGGGGPVGAVGAVGAIGAIGSVPTERGGSNTLHDQFQPLTSNVSMEPASDTSRDKITEDKVQELMEQRRKSAASQHQPTGA